MTTDKIYTTLAQIRAHSPCEDGYRKLCKSLGGIDAYGKDTPITFKQIYESNGYSDTLWCLCAIEEKWFPLLRHFACDMAESVKHLMKDERSLKSIEVARLYADGKATEAELKSARDAAWAAAGAAAEAARAAAGAAEAARAARDAARDAAWAAAWATARAAKNAQMQHLFKYCETGDRQYGFTLNKGGT